MLKLAFSAILVLYLTTGSMAFVSYVYYVPNGDTVPNPCQNGPRVWEAIGHMNIYGAGRLTQFGRDFQRLNRDWPQLCLLDSDGDGVTNGVELGDPNCSWTMGSTPTGPAISNPAICEPAGQGACASVFDICELVIG